MPNEERKGICTFPYIDTFDTDPVRESPLPCHGPMSDSLLQKRKSVNFSVSVALVLGLAN